MNSIIYGYFKIMQDKKKLEDIVLKESEENEESDDGV